MPEERERRPNPISPEVRRSAQWPELLADSRVEGFRV